MLASTHTSYTHAPAHARTHARTHVYRPVLLRFRKKKRVSANTVDPIIFACLNCREFLVLGLFTKFRIREFLFFFSSAIIIIFFARFLNWRKLKPRKYYQIYSRLTELHGAMSRDVSAQITRFCGLHRTCVWPALCALPVPFEKKLLYPWEFLCSLPAVYAWPGGPSNKNLKIKFIITFFYFD